MSIPGPSSIKVIAITQEHRGHGLSTAAYFLARAYGAQKMPVLLADLTRRPQRVQLLARQMPAEHVVLWTAPAPWLRDIPGLLTRMRADVQGKIRCILIDGEASQLEHAQGLPAGKGIDYLLIASEATIDGQQVAKKVAERFESLRERQSVGVVFARVNGKDMEDLPQETADGLPVLGYWPADYRLALTDEDAALSVSTEPHPTYLAAITRLGTTLARLVGLR